jgi:hypothetical protein
MHHRRCVTWTVSLAISIMLCLAASSVHSGTKGELKPPSEGQSQILSLADGSSLVGKIIEVREADVIFEGEFGEMTIPKANIKEVKLVSSSAFKGGKYWFPNPNQTRLFIGPTGRMLPKGRGYFSDSYIFFPSVAYGFTNNINMGFGITIFPWIGMENQFLYFTPKIGFPAGDNFDLAVGALAFQTPDFDDDDNDDDSYLVGVLYGSGTVGSEDNSFSLSIGYGFIEDELADKPLVIFGGELRVARRMSLVTENWVIPDVDPVVISYGVRFFGEGIAVDLAFLNVANEDAIFPGIPYIDFVYNF